MINLSNYIGNFKKNIISNRTINICDFNNNIIAKAPDLSSWELTRTFHTARKGTKSIIKTTIEDIFEVFVEASKIYKKRSDYDELISLSRGNPISSVIESRFIISKMLSNFNLIIDENFLVKNFTGKIKRKDYHTNFFPVGLVGLVSSSTTREVTPYAALNALSMKNSLIIKSDTKEPFSSIELVENLIHAGLPENSLSVITINSNNMPDLGYKLYNNTNKLIVFGSDESIRKIAYFQLSNKLNMNDISNLPLPNDIIFYGTGRSKSIVDKSADINKAAYEILLSAFELPALCLKSQFAIVDNSIYENFVDECSETASRFKVGNLLDKKTQVGHVHPEYISIANSMIENTLNLGGILITGGEITSSIVQPIIIKDLPIKSDIFKEECYAPLLGIIPSKSIDHTIKLLNESVNHTINKTSLKISYYGESKENFDRIITEVKGNEFSMNRRTTEINPLIPHQGIYLAKKLTNIAMVN